MVKHELPYREDLFLLLRKTKCNTRTELRLPARLLTLAHQAAERAGVSYAKWYRTAILRAVSASVISERGRLERLSIQAEDRGPVFINDNDLTPYEQHLAGQEKEETDQ